MTMRTMVAAGMLTVLAATTAYAQGGHENHGAAHGSPTAAAVQQAGIPAGAGSVQARLAASPRHAEWAMVRVGADSIRAWVVYPERRDNAPVIVVVHEIFGLSHWVRGVADQLAADGFIAIAPDLLTMKSIPAGPDGAPSADSARAAIRTLTPDETHRYVRAVAEYGMSLPAAAKTYGIVGYCWGGTVSFEHAVRYPDLGASVVYYGTSPAPETLGSVRAPVLGLYAENDQRVNATIAPADSALRALGKTFAHHTYPGAGHGFLRAQEGSEANAAAAARAWPETVAWFRRHLDR